MNVGPTTTMASSSSKVIHSRVVSAKIHQTIASFRSMRRSLAKEVSIGFIPTMGALHDGHLSLVEAARRTNDVVVASIFVNPTQFAPHEDLDKYPRQLEKDVELLSGLGVDHVFAPASVDTMYGPNHLTYVDPTGFDDTAEGRARPGHFRGVATIVTKLLNIVQPTRAYFGQKDAAQCVLIRRIVADLDLDVLVHVEPTVREPDGLAMSSRNAYLTVQERRAAPVVYRAIMAAQQRFDNLRDDDAASIDSDALRSAVEEVLKSEPLVTSIQYVAIDNPHNMQPLARVQKSTTGGGGGAIVSVACKLGNVRLIDNIMLG